MEHNLNAPRRIVTSNLPLPLDMKDLANAEPAVQVICESVTQHPELDGNAYRATVFTHDSIPTNNDGIDIVPREIPNNGLVIPNGANIRFNDLAPGQLVPMHRTQTTDYNIIISGQIHLLTPNMASAGADSFANIQTTLCKPGDVIVQRGTIHAWENRTNEWARSIVVMLGAKPTTTTIEGQTEERHLKDCFLNGPLS